MDLAQVDLKFTCQVVVLPYPGRDHINSMMNLCKLIAMRQPNVLITFIVTEEWYGFLCSESVPVNIQYGKIPNAIPSEIGRGKDFPGFLEAVLTKMEGPVERLLDQLELPTPSIIVYDTYLSWVVGLANRRNLPAASFWPMSATVFSILHHYEVLVQNGHFPAKQSDIERGKKQVNYIRGILPIQAADLPRDTFGIKGREVLKRFMEAISQVPKAQFVLLSSVYELEYRVIDSLKVEFPIPIYSIGPAIPYFKANERSSQINSHNDSCYIAWLDAQPKDSVLYISQGSFLYASSDLLDEVVAGIHDSGIRFFLVAHDGKARFQGGGSSDKGLIVPWCDQLKVLCHPSIGGFWSRCGWNSTKEGAYAGLPMLASPITWDQFTNSKQIVDDWKIGWRMKGNDQSMVRRKGISELLKKFMNLKCDERKEMRKRARELRKICQRATAEGGSSEIEIQAFIMKVLN